MLHKCIYIKGYWIQYSSMWQGTILTHWTTVLQLNTSDSSAPKVAVFHTLCDPSVSLLKIIYVRSILKLKCWRASLFSHVPSTGCTLNNVNRTPPESHYLLIVIPFFNSWKGTSRDFSSEMQWNLLHLPPQQIHQSDKDLTQAYLRTKFLPGCHLYAQQNPVFSCLSKLKMVSFYVELLTWG